MNHEKRERCKIVRARYGDVHHGIMSVDVYVELGSSGQGMSGVRLDDGPLRDSYIADLCAAFGVRDLDALVGREGYALYAFGGWNEPIDGLEGPCGVFSINAWQRKHFPETPTLVEERRQQLERAVTQTAADLSHRRKSLAAFNAKHPVDADE